jgi:hypothetical protein
MESLTRLVAESFARHGFDRPVDYRRLHWSRWFRCESPHSLLSVPSKAGVFALAEEVMDFGNSALRYNDTHVGTAASAVQPERSSAAAGSTPKAGMSPAHDATSKRMLAVLQFGEDDDMAFVLDRMLSRQNPMRARLVSGSIVVRYVVIEEESQRRSICAALNQWLISSGEKATGIGAHFASSLKLTPTTDHVGTAASPVQAVEPQADPEHAPPHHSPSPLPSGF